MAVASYVPTPWQDGPGGLALSAADMIAMENRLAAYSVLLLQPQQVPSNTTPPSVTGSTVQGQTLTANPGVWSNVNLTGQPYDFQWLRGGIAISGQTGTTYVTTTADVGFSIAVQITAHGPYGTAVATSAGTAPIASAAPAGSAPQNLSAPVVSGQAVQGQTLTATPGTWSGTPTSYTWQWYRGGVAIAGATGTGTTIGNYTLVSADVSLQVNVKVAATNANGTSSFVASNPTTAVAASSVATNTVPPLISGQPIVGSVLTVSPGTWTGNPMPTSYTYQWYRLPVAGGAATLHIQGAIAENGSTSPQTALLANPITAGDQILVAAWSKSSTGNMAVSGVTDNRSNAYTHLQTVVGFWGTLDLELWWCASAAASASATVSVAYSGTLQASTLAVWATQCRGLTAIDTGGSASNTTGTTATGPTDTPTVAGDAVFTFAALSSVPSASPDPAVWSDIGGPATLSANTNPIAWATISNTSPLVPTWTQTSGPWAILLQNFKVASGSPTAITGQTSQSYTVASADIGSALTCAVQAVTSGVGTSAAVNAPSTATVTAAGGAPISNLADNLLETSLPSTFVAPHGTVVDTTSGAQLRDATAGTGGTVLASASTYTLIASSLFAQLTPSPYGNGSKTLLFGASAAQTPSSSGGTPANGVYWQITPSGGAYAIQPFIVQAGVVTAGSSTAYAAATHKFFRVRERTGTMYWDYSADGVTWTNAWTSSYTISVASLYFTAQNSYTGSETVNVAVVANVNVTPASPPGPGGGTTYTPPGPYTSLVWSDEFTGTSLDTTKWTAINSTTMGTGGNDNAWSPNNVVVGPVTLGGVQYNCLSLVASSSSMSGQISTMSNGFNWGGTAKAAFTHGGFFARMWMPPGNAMWPAFWSVTRTGYQYASGKAAELDYVEMGMGSGTGTTGATLSDFNVYQTIHLAGPNDAAVHTYVSPSNCSSGFHDYGCTFDGTSGNISFYFDNVLTVTRTGNTMPPSGQNEWILLVSLAPGGSQWFGSAAGDTYPQTMYVDWVRIFQ